MDAAAELGRNLVVSKHQTQPEYGDEQADAGRDRLPNPSRETKFSGANANRENFPCSADHEKDWQPYPVEILTLAICDDLYIHTYHNRS